MAWILFLSGVLVSWWAGAGLRRGAAGATDAARLSDLATEIAAAGDAVLRRVEERLAELDETVVAAEQRLAQLRTALEPPAPVAAAPISAAPVAAARVEAPAAEAPAVSTSPAQEPEPHRLVCDLADAGQDEQAIARESGLLAGEVRLVLGLRKLRRT